MTKAEVLVLSRSLNQLGKLTGAKFSYAVAKNLNLAKNEVESINKAREMTEKYTEYDNERVELAKKHADKDKDGKPKMRQTANPEVQEFVMSEINEKKFQKELKILNLKNKELIAAREKQMEEFTALLETDSDFKAHMMKRDDIPEEITTNQMAGIINIVEE